MKRQGNADDATKVEDTTMVRKKKKRVVEKVEEESKNGVELAPAAAAAAVEEDCWLGWEEWPLLTREIVDEEMSWGYFSLPIWGVEFMAEAYTSLFSDVVWDDDIWNLKSIQEIPANF